jgi:hypothetical protein
MRKASAGMKRKKLNELRKQGGASWTLTDTESGHEKA